MIAVPPLLFALAANDGILLALGAVPATGNRGPANHTTAGGGVVEEFLIDGACVARRVTACNKSIAWLREDIAEIAEAHLDTKRLELERAQADSMAFLLRRTADPHERIDCTAVQAALLRANRLGKLVDQTRDSDTARAALAQHLLEQDLAK